MLQARLFIEEIGNNFPSGSYCCTGGFGPCLRQLQFSSVQLLSHVRLSATPGTAARQASLGEIPRSEDAGLHGTQTLSFTESESCSVVSDSL